MTARPRAGIERADARPEQHPQIRAQTLALVLLAVMGLGAFGFLTWLMWSHGQVGFDQPLLTLARTWTAYTPEWAFLSEAANLPLVALGVGTVLWLFWRHDRRGALLVILVLAAATAGSEAVKQLVSRPRPPGSDTVVPGVIYSFPSGHVLESVTVLGIIAVLLWRSRLPLALRVAFPIGVSIFVVLVAVARVAINAHYPSDVLAGLLAGVGILAIFILLSERRGGVARPTDEPRTGDRTLTRMAHQAAAGDLAGEVGPSALDGHSGPRSDVERPISQPNASAAPERAPERTLSSSIVIAAGFLGVAACLLVLGTLAEAIRDEELNALDAFASPFLHGLASPQLDLVMRSATFLGSNEVVVPAFILIAVGLIVIHRLREALFLAVVVLGSLALNGAMKLFFERPRPQLPWSQVLPDFSFPSGHSMISLAFLLGLAIVIWQVRGSRWGRVAVVAAVIGGVVVGTSRIYLGYHYLTDVIGGLAAAILWILVVVGAFSWGQHLLDGRRGSPDPQAR